MCPNLISNCLQNLIEKKSEILASIQKSRLESIREACPGDEIDLSTEYLQDFRERSMTDRRILQLHEIDSALDRIEKGEYGICEETGENIEEERLKLLPWTRFSIEGAEIQEAIRKKYAL